MPDVCSLPKIDHVSFSQVALFETCPAKWFLERVMKVPTESNPALVKGREVHEDIEWALRGMHAHQHPESEAIAAWVREQGIVIDPKNIEVTGSTYLASGMRFEARADAVSDDTVYDWKTSSKGWRKGEEHTRGQAFAYARVFARPNVSYVIVKPDCVIDVRTVSPSQDAIDAYFVKADTVVTAMRSGVYPRVKQRGCWNCPVRNTCKPWLSLEPIVS